MKTHLEVRKLFEDFWKSKSHFEAPPISLVPENDPTTLFTSAGMQPLIPYLLGESHPMGKRLYNIQRCFRSQDIEEIGDNRHQTFFEMMGNWSLGDYFKAEQLPWVWEFYTRVIGLPKDKLYVTIYEGDANVGKDNESYKIWKSLGLVDDHIWAYGSKKNWWSRSGTPDKMPVGEIGGPDSEIFYDFGTDHDLKFGDKCHPNCDCGRFMEIGNSVFIQYQKNTDNNLVELAQKNVDFGGGLERVLAVSANDADVFKTDVFKKIIITIEKITNKKYSENERSMRVIADHMKAATFLMFDGVFPGNKTQGYFLRRLIRRSAVKMYQLKNAVVDAADFQAICKAVLETYQGIYFDIEKDSARIFPIIFDEINRFNRTLEKGIAEVWKIELIDGKKAFDLYQNFGFPVELTEELFLEKGQKIDKEQFRLEVEKHKELSRTTSAGMFKGGLVDSNEKTVKFHTTAHILLQVLKEVYGKEVVQEGANINEERLRFDFRLMHKPDPEEVIIIENKINEIISKKMAVFCETMPKEEALKIGANASFRDKYPDNVKVYFISQNDKDMENAISKEFCGGPHVTNTGEIGPVKIKKVEKIAANMMRIYII
jgi:alanyl-tRNA synthetase